MKVSKELNKQIKSLLDKNLPKDSDATRVVSIEISSEGESIKNSIMKEFDEFQKAAKYAESQSKKAGKSTLVYIVTPWGFSLV